MLRKGGALDGVFDFFEKPLFSPNTHKIRSFLSPFSEI